MNSFSLVHLFLVLGIGQGLFLIFAIWQIKESEFKDANRILITILGLATAMLIGKVFAPQFEGSWVIRLALFTDTSIFLFGPLVYQYANRLLSPSRYHTINYWHYAPALIHIIYFLWSLTMPAHSFLEIMYTQLWFVLIATEGLGLISFIGYIIASMISFRKTKKLGEIYSPTSSITIKQYLVTFLGILGVLCSFWLVSFVGGYFMRLPLSTFTYKMMWTITPIFFYTVGYFSLSKPDILRLKISRKRDRLHGEELELLKTKLRYLMEKELVYTQSNITLSVLADKLETNSNNLSWLLNEVYNKTFHEFINEMRISAFQEKVKKEEHRQRTLLGLALEVGFNSKSTFNKAFKLHTNMTPRVYATTVKKEFLKSSKRCRVTQ